MGAKLYLAWRGPEGDHTLAWATFPEPTRDPPWSELHQLPDRSSEAGPALAAFGAELFMAWRGPQDDHNLFYATLDSSNSWTDQIRLSDRGSEWGPALAMFGDKLYMAWRGIGDDFRLFWATFPEPTRTPPWSDQHALSDRGSMSGPALAVFGDKLFMAWRGIPGDESLYWSTNSGSGWSAQKPLPDRGSLDGPALVVFNGNLYMIWRGTESEDGEDQRLYLSSYTGAEGAGAWSPQTVLRAVNSAPVPSSSRPAVGTFQEIAFGDEQCILVSVGLQTAVIYGSPSGIGDTPPDPGDAGGDDPGPPGGGGSPSDDQMFYSAFDGGAVSLLRRIPNSFTLMQPALASYGEPTVFLPHPIRRRTQHSPQNLIQSSFGRQGNFELLVPQGELINHYFRDNDSSNGAWHLNRGLRLSYAAGTPRSAVRTPRSVTFLQSNFLGDGVHGNFEAVVRVTPLVGEDYLDFWFFDSKTRVWNGPSPIIADAQPISGLTGGPALIQSSFGRQGNFELLVPHGEVINHYFRDNDSSNGAWHLNRGLRLSYAAGSPRSAVRTPRSVTFLQSNFLGDGVHGNFEAVVRVTPLVGEDYLDFWFFDSKTRVWNGPSPIIADAQPISGVTGDPALIQSSFGRQGNFELLVPQGELINHYFRDNDSSNGAWHLNRGRRLSYAAGTPRSAVRTPRSVTFLQSNFLGDGVHGNFEAVVRVTPLVGEDYLDFWFFDSKTRVWNGPSPIIADAQPISGVTGF